MTGETPMSFGSRMENRRVVRRVGPGRNRLVVLGGIEAKSHGITDRPLVGAFRAGGDSSRRINSSVARR